MIGNLYLVFRAVRGSFWRSPAAVRLLLLQSAAILFFRTVLGRSDSTHLYFGTLFMLLTSLHLLDHAFSSGIERVFRRGSGWNVRLTGACAVGLAALFSWQPCHVTAAYEPWEGLRKSWRRLLQHPPSTAATAELPNRIGRCLVSDDQARKLAAITDAIRERTLPGETVYAFDDSAALLFFSDRRSATPYFDGSSRVDRCPAAGGHRVTRPE